MLDAETIIASAQRETPQAGWQVWREHRSFFLRMALIGIVFLIGGGYGAMYLQGHPDTAFVLGAVGDPTTVPLDPGLFMTARTIDFVVVGVVALLGLYSLIWGIYRTAVGGGQLLVLTPEGLVLRRQSAAQSFPFAAVRSLTTTRVYGTLQVRLIFTDGTKKTIKLDGRFGSPKLIARAILAAYRRMYPDAQRGRVIDVLRRRGR